MSRYGPEISSRAWRSAIVGLAIITSATIIVALLIARQSPAIDTTPEFDRLDEQWMIQAGRAEADRLVLAPAANSIGTALHPIDSPFFTLQARIDLATSAGNGGLIVQADDADHFTAFLISPDGYFRISDFRNGAWIDRVAWRAWPHIRRDGNSNVIRAECRSGSCTFFVNDEWTWQENGIPPTHRIGVAAGGSEVRFDQLGWQP